jgi:hypothetical protein
VLVVPLLVLAMALAPFFALATGAAFLLGLTLAIVGFKRIYRVFQAKGIQDFNEQAPFILRGGLLAILTQVYYTWKMPRTLGLWFFLEVLGTAWLIAGLLIAKIIYPPLYSGQDRASEIAKDNGRINPVQDRQPHADLPEVPSITGDRDIDLALADLADEKQPANRGRGADRLAQMKPNQHRSVVARKLAEVAAGDNPFGQGEAIRALKTWATVAEIPVLIAFFEKGGLRPEAGDGLRTIGQPAEDAVANLLKHPDIGLRRDAIVLLQDIGSERSLGVLQAIADGPDRFTAEPDQADLSAIKKRTGK